MSKLYDVENHIYMYCIVYRSVIFYSSEKAYNQVDFYNLILSLVNQLINVDTRNIRYDNVTLIPLVLQLGLRIGLIQRMGAN